MSSPVRVSIQDIAKSVDAPLQQVVKVILGQPDVTDELRHKVFGAMEDAGLIRIPRDSAAGTIGVVLPNTVIGDYIGEVARGITETAKAHGYSIMINIQNPEREDDLVHLLEAKGCDGVISVVPYNYERLIELCRFYRREYVLVDYQDEGDIRDVPSVEADNRQSIMGVMRHLFDLGHRRIGFITGDLRMISARQRLQGYKDALRDTGIRYDPALVGTGDWLHTRAYTVAKALLQLNPPPTAIVGSNDFSAFGAMQAAHQLGLEVGRDVSITGFDDIRMASTVTPALTTVRQPMYEMGVTAVEMLIKRMNSEPIRNLHVRLPTTLVIRESTGQVEP